jgi:hypothetical protein
MLLDITSRYQSISAFSLIDPVIEGLIGLKEQIKEQLVTESESV